MDAHHFMWCRVWFTTLLTTTASLCAVIDTNVGLLAQVRGWERMAGADDHAVREGIEREMSADAPWRVAVLQSTNGCYEWGLYARVYHGRALLGVRAPVEAYRSLVQAAAFSPLAGLLAASHAMHTNAARRAALLPCGIAPDPVLQWWHGMGEACRTLGRYQDAAWYLEQGRALCDVVTGTAARGALPRAESDMRAEFLASLAAVRQSQGRPNEALQLYAALFAMQPRQPVPIWHAYIRALFHAGRFDDGVQAILACARQHGISDHDVERDYTLQDACRYWLHFEPLDMLEWYEILGAQLAREELREGKEALLALLINTRDLLKRLYPEYCALEEDDLAALRARLEDERTNETRAARYRMQDGKVEVASRPLDKSKTTRNRDGSSTVAALQNEPGRLGYAGMSNILVEDAVNAALQALRENIRRGRDEPGPWLALLQQFPSNLLMETVVDGVTAHGLIYQTLGSVYSYSELRSNALVWLERAKSEAGLYGNQDRLGEAVMWLADNYAAGGPAQRDEAEYYCGWAEKLCASNWCFAARVAAVRARLAERTGDSAGAIRILQEAVERFGESVPQVVYERLARMLYQSGEHRAGFAVYVEGLKRTKCKMQLGMWNHMIDGMLMNRSMHTVEELKQVRALLRTCAARYPAVVDNAPTQARLLNLSEAAWIGEHIRLAELAAAGAYTEDNWQVISNCVAGTPSVRAGLMYTEAQAARSAGSTNALDWRGWVAAWESVGAEQRPGRADSPADTGGFDALNELLIAQLERHAARLDRAGAALISACVRQRMGRLAEERYARLVRVLKLAGAAEDMEELERRRAELRTRSARQNGAE